MPLKKKCYIEALLITLFSNVEKNYKLQSEILNIIKNSMKTELDKEPKFKHNLIKKKKHLTELCKGSFSELYIIYMHLKYLRLVVDIAARFG